MRSWSRNYNLRGLFYFICFILLRLVLPDGAEPLTWCSRDVRLMKRRNSSPPDDTATEESTPVRQSVADFRFSLRPRIVSPGGGGRAKTRRQSKAVDHYERCDFGCEPRASLDKPLSLLRNSSRVRIAATAEAMSGSSLICALKYSTSSGHAHTIYSKSGAAAHGTNWENMSRLTFVIHPEGNNRFAKLNPYFVCVCF